MHVAAKWLGTGAQLSAQARKQHKSMTPIARADVKLLDFTHN